MNKLSLSTLLLVFTSYSYANLSCIPDDSGCNTRLGTLVSKGKNEKSTGIYLNEQEVLSINSDTVDQASVYYDLPSSNNKNKKIIITILRYINDDCVIQGRKTNCPRYIIADFSGKKPSFSEPFTPPVMDSNLMNAIWNDNEVTVKFSDRSVFHYKNGVILMIDNGVMSQ